MPKHAAPNMHSSTAPHAAGYLPHHSLRYLKESASFALGLNYVQFAKLGLKPLGGGVSLTYLSMQSIPSSDWENEAERCSEGEREKTAAA